MEENKARQIFWKTNISYVRLVVRGKKCSIFGKFGVLCFLVTSVLRFALLRYYRQIVWTVFLSSEWLIILNILYSFPKEMIFVQFFPGKLESFKNFDKQFILKMRDLEEI